MKTKITMGTVNSSTVSSIGFSGQKDQQGILRVLLSDGTEHDYPGTSWAAYKKFVTAKSHGQHYNQHIRGRKAA